MYNQIKFFTLTPQNPAMRLLPLAFLALVFTSCSTGYKKQGGMWIWVSYDESVGKRVTPIDPHDAERFEVLRPGEYARDGRSVFYMGRTLKGADPATFEMIDGKEYGRDARAVFFRDQRVIGAEASTFEVLEFPYARDARHVFCGTLPMDLSPAEVKEFRVTNTDKLMAGMRSTVLLSEFIRQNPGYQWLDTLGITHIIVGDWGTGVTKTRKFQGLREVK